MLAYPVTSTQDPINSDLVAYPAMIYFITVTLHTRKI